MTMPDYRFDGDNLTIATVARLAAGQASCDLTEDAWNRVERARIVVDRALSKGATIYGATTGVGSQRDTKVAPDKRADFPIRMIISEATSFPGPAFEPNVARAALVVLINNFATGRTGVRPTLVKRLLDFLASENMPAVQRETSFGTGDISALAQLMLPLVGRSSDGRGPDFGNDTDLVAKESVSLLDNNSFGLGHGALVLVEAGRLSDAFDAVAAVALEGFRANLAPHSKASGRGHRQPGQARSRATLARCLEGSRLWRDGEARFLQDPLSFRSITQTHGAVHEVLAWATRQCETEMNASVDNPLVDLETETIVTSASMTVTSPTLALDCLRQAVARAAQQCCERAVKLQWSHFTGLPTGLADEGAADGGVLGIMLNHIASARQGSILAASPPVLLQGSAQLSDGIEDVSSHFPLSVSQTERAITFAWEILAVELAVAVWAIARRDVNESDLGRGPRVAHHRVRPLLHIGEEGERLFDMRPIISLLRDDEFLVELGVDPGARTSRA